MLSLKGKLNLYKLYYQVIAVGLLANSLPTQLSHKLQWEVRGSRNVLQVKQYLSFTTCWLMRTSLVRGGGRYVDDPEVSENREVPEKFTETWMCDENSAPIKML